MPVTARLALCALLLGCDAQVDSSYPGEALARISGTTAGFGLDEVAGSAAILWNANRGPDVPSGPVSAAVLHPHGPAALTFIVISAPPPEAFFAVDGDGGRVAEGYLHLVRAGAGDAPTIDDFVGTAIDFALVYVDGSIAEGSLMAAYLGGVPAPGYHLARWRATAGLSAAQATFADRCAAAWPDADCGASRRYQLLPTAEDLDTAVSFVGHVGR